MQISGSGRPGYAKQRAITRLSIELEWDFGASNVPLVACNEEIKIAALLASRAPDLISSLDAFV